MVSNKKRKLEQKACLEYVPEDFSGMTWGVDVEDGDKHLGKAAQLLRVVNGNTKKLKAHAEAVNLIGGWSDMLEVKMSGLIDVVDGMKDEIVGLRKEIEWLKSGVGLEAASNMFEAIEWPEYKGVVW